MPGPGQVGGVTTRWKKRGGPRAKAGDLRRSVRLLRRFTSDPRPYRLGMVLLVLEAATAVVEPIPIAFLVDFLQGARPTLRELGGPTLLASERFETILLLTLAIVLIAAINSAADSLTEVCMARGGRSLGYNIRVAMYSHLQRLPLAYHDTKRTGDVLTRVTGDVLVVEEFVVKSVSNIVGSLLVLTGSFVFLLTQSWSVALVAIVVIPMLALVSNHYSRRIKVASRAQRDHEGELASTAQEMLTSIRLVQSYARGTVDLEQFSGQTKKSMRASLTAANIQAQFSFVIALVEALSISAVVWLGVWLVDRDAITVGTLVLFVLLLQNMFKPARKIVSEWYKIGKVFASVERIEDLLDREIVVRDHPDAAPAPALQGRLTFQHVGFTYPAEREDGSESTLRPPVLVDVDFGIEPGEVVALVGYSGAGKSTIAQLVPRLYDADRGEVLVDGLKVQDLTLASLRSQISLVLQDTVLLSGTVAENIGYGIADATRRDVVEAARLANAHEFITGLPDGYETHLGERGSTLSGGQRQRIAIARAFIRQTPILILDEPTTGLDSESARSVVDALRTLMQGRTTLVISHDLGLIRCAGRVLVVEAGRIVESGEHEHLMKAGGAYAELFTAHDGTPDRAGTARAPLASQVSSSQVRLPPRNGASRGGIGPRTLSDGLHRRLPGLARVLDTDFAARQVELLLDDDADVEDTTVGKVWLRSDGTCTLRYTPRLRAEHETPTVGPLLARLHPDDASAASYLGHRVQTLRRARAGSPPPPWRATTAIATDTGLALHPFPFDPDLPTLARATDPGSVLRMLAGGGLTGLPDVDVVHHPREGACVLRYRFPNDAGDGDAPATYYAKVYGNGDGEVTHRVLTTLDGGEGGAGGTRFPRAVAYSPPGRLLVTEALPGRALVPLLLSGSPDQPPRTWSERRSSALRAAVRASGEALATLHAQTRPDARVHTGVEELADLDRELQVVAGVWPEVAERVRRRLRGLTVPTPERNGFVLSHGDYTPAQVLLGAADQVGVVDLDTLCWAEPALDLGRYLAHLRLRVATRTGDPTAPLADDLAAEFVAGYGVAAADAAAGTGGHRLSFYTGTTLARTALHACRQLKAVRLATALDLLAAVPRHDRRTSP